MCTHVCVHTHTPFRTTYLPQSPRRDLSSSTSAHCATTDIEDNPKQTFRDMWGLWLVNGLFPPESKQVLKYVKNKNVYNKNHGIRDVKTAALFQ